MLLWYIYNPMVYFDRTVADMPYWADRTQPLVVSNQRITLPYALQASTKKIKHSAPLIYASSVF